MHNNGYNLKMGNKRKGQLTTDIDWHKHLRKISKRFFWKGERLAEKQMINENLSEFHEITDLPLLTFDKLIDLIEENRFENNTYKKIAEKILDAQRDWKTSVNNLNEFITALEKEIGGTATKTGLNKLLKKYDRNITQNAWKAESVSSLLEIFELTKEINLRKIFNELIEWTKTK